MAVTRNIEEFEIAKAEYMGWGNDINIEVNDPDGGGFSVVYVSLKEAKAFVKELKAAIKELEAK